MHTYTLLRIDWFTNTIVEWTYVHADGWAEAIKARPGGWTRRETRARRGIVT